MKYATIIIAAIALAACQPEKPKALEFREPNVAECKRAVEIASQSAMLISFEKGRKMDYIKRTWELTENPIERMYAQRVGDYLFIAHAHQNKTEPDIKQIKEHIGTFEEMCNAFELK